jgi:hypothetical protein
MVVGYHLFGGPYCLIFRIEETLKMEAARSSETLISNHYISLRNNPDNYKLYHKISGKRYWVRLAKMSYVSMASEGTTNLTECKDKMPPCCCELELL